MTSPEEGAFDFMAILFSIIGGGGGGALFVWITYLFNQRSDTKRRDREFKHNLLRLKATLYVFEARMQRILSIAGHVAAEIPNYEFMPSYLEEPMPSFDIDFLFTKEGKVDQAKNIALYKWTISYEYNSLISFSKLRTTMINTHVDIHKSYDSYIAQDNKTELRGIEMSILPAVKNFIDDLDEHF